MNLKLVSPTRTPCDETDRRKTHYQSHQYHHNPTLSHEFFISEVIIVLIIFIFLVNHTEQRRPPFPLPKRRMDAVFSGHRKSSIGAGNSTGAGGRRSWVWRMRRRVIRRAVSRSCLTVGWGFVINIIMRIARWTLNVVIIRCCRRSISFRRRWWRRAAAAETCYIAFQLLGAHFFVCVVAGFNGEQKLREKSSSDSIRFDGETRKPTQIWRCLGEIKKRWCWKWKETVSCGQRMSKVTDACVLLPSGSWNLKQNMCLY